MQTIVTVTLVTMAGRHPKAMRPRDESAHPVIKHAIEQQYVDTGIPYVIGGFASHEAANQGRLSVRRGGQHLGVSVAAWVVDSPDGTAELHFRLHSKDAARKYVVAQTGGDPSKLKFNPHARGAGPVVDDFGQPIAR